MNPGSRKIWRFYLIAFLLGFGYVCGYYAATSLLVSRVGPASLLPVYLISALVTLFISLFLYFKVDHVSRQRMFAGLFLTLALVVGGSWCAIHFWPTQRWIYYAVRILFSPVYILADLEYWLAASIYLSSSESRKHFPLLVSAGIIGEIAGGIFIFLGAAAIRSPNLPLFWAGILLICPLLLIGVRFPVSAGQGLGTSVIWGEMLAPGSGRRSRSPFATPLAMLLLVFWASYAFFSHGTDYVYNVFAQRNISGEDPLTAFFGRVATIANLVVLASQMLLSFRLYARQGLERILFFIVLMNLGAWALIVFSPSLLSVTVAQIAIFFFLDHFSTASLHSALNVFPDRIRGRIRLFSEGLGRPLGTILFFSCMGIFSLSSHITQMTHLMLALASLLVPYAFIFKYYYVRHLLNALRSSDSSIVSTAVDSLGRSSAKSSVQPLLDLLKTTRQVNLKQAIVTSLSRMHSKEAFQEILSLIHDANDRLRLSAIDAMNDYKAEEGTLALIHLLKSPEKISFRSRRSAVRVLQRHLGEEVLPALTSSLQSEHDPQAIANTIESIGLVPRSASITRLRPYLKHSNHRIRTNAAIAIYLASGTEDADYAEAVSVIDVLFRSQELVERCAGIYAIGVLKLKAYEDELVGLLGSEDEKLREHACVALAGLKNPAFAPVFLKLLLDSTEQRAVGSARRLDAMPRSSRKLLFKKLATLPKLDRDLIEWRLRKTQLDFSEEMPLLPVTALDLTATLQDAASLKS